MKKYDALFDFFIALRDLRRETREAASSRNSNARCKNCMLTVKHEKKITWPKNDDSFQNEEPKPPLSLNDQAQNRTYHDDSFYLPVSRNEKSSSSDHTMSCNTDRNSSDMFCHDSKCCITLEKIKKNVDRRCQSENKVSHISKNTKPLTLSINHIEPVEDANPLIHRTNPIDLFLANASNFRSRDSKKKEQCFKKSAKSTR